MYHKLAGATVKTTGTYPLPLKFIFVTLSPFQGNPARRDAARYRVVWRERHAENDQGSVRRLL